MHFKSTMTRDQVLRALESRVAQKNFKLANSMPAQERIFAKLKSDSNFILYFANGKAHKIPSIFFEGTVAQTDGGAQINGKFKLKPFFTVLVALLLVLIWALCIYLAVFVQQSGLKQLVSLFTGLAIWTVLAVVLVVGAPKYLQKDNNDEIVAFINAALLG